jgi:hypothetical protein
MVLVRRFAILSLLALSLALGTTAALPSQEASAHTYTTTYGYCWKFMPGVWYYREEVTTWYHNWWGTGHYAAFTNTYSYGRCYIS